MTKTKIPSFKSSFGSLDWHVPIVLKIVGEKRVRLVENVNRELVEAFLSFLRRHGREAEIIDRKALTYEGETYRGRKANPRYLISQLYSLAIPSCISLGLVSQQEKEEMLTFFGRKILAALEKSQAEFLHEEELVKDLLRAVVVYVDHKHWMILDTLSESADGLSIGKLTTELQHHGVILGVSQRAIEQRIKRTYVRDQQREGRIKTWRDRERMLIQLEDDMPRLIEQKILRAKINKVRALLWLMRSLDLIWKQGEKYQLDRSSYLRMKEARPWYGADEISPLPFFNSIKRHYEELRRKQKYVRIPILRDVVCQELDMPWDLFNEKLMELGYEFSGYRIVLIPPITSKVWGIFKGRTNYYYMSIEEMK